MIVPKPRETHILGDSFYLLQKDRINGAKGKGYTLGAWLDTPKSRSDSVNFWANLIESSELLTVFDFTLQANLLTTVSETERISLYSKLRNQSPVYYKVYLKAMYVSFTENT